LLQTEPRYRAVVTRETDEETAAHRNGTPAGSRPAKPLPDDRGDGPTDGRDDALSDDDVLHRLEEIEETA
ncbi:ABC transporter ATP-binding protein, partial [Streptomyces tendae]